MTAQLCYAITKLTFCYMYKKPGLQYVQTISRVQILISQLQCFYLLTNIIKLTHSMSIIYSQYFFISLLSASVCILSHSGQHSISFYDGRQLMGPFAGVILKLVVQSVGKGNIHNSSRGCPLGYHFQILTSLIQKSRNKTTTIDCGTQKRSELIFRVDSIIASDRYIKCEQKMVRQQQRILKGGQGMQKQVKIEWEMVLPEDQSENGKNTGGWSTHENLLYAIFITQNKSTMVSKRKRKNLRVFDRMAEFIGSRNSLQCRSHHQKLIEKFMEIKNIINIFKKYYGAQFFREQSQRYGTKGLNARSEKTKDQQNIEAEIEVEDVEIGSGQKPELGSCGEIQIKTPDVVSPEAEQRNEPCAQQVRQEQCYYPMSYFYANGLMQYPFYGFYPVCAFQSA